MSQYPSSDGSEPTRAFAEFAFGSHTHVIDVSRPLAWLSPEEMHIDLDDPQQRRFGDYELIGKIGQGGMGVVYRARQHGLERDVAIKLLAAGPWASEEFIERFRREARSAARMQHPNIVEIYEFGHRQGLNYFSMRLIEGQSLAQRLHARGPMPAIEAAKLLRTLAEAMDYAHRLGVLHLDLKPANVLLTASDVPLIADFGLARRIDAGHEGGVDEISGSPSYMAPEQATLASHPLTTATDIYGLGAVLYECLTSRPPFLGANAQATLERVVAEAPPMPRSLRKSIPEDLEAICMTCLAKDPGDRYSSAQALADDLQRFVEGRAVSVRPLNTLQRLLRWGKREPKLAIALAVAATLLFVGTATTAWQWRAALAQRDAAEKAESLARSERDNAKIASEIGAYLYTYGGDAKDSADRARGLIAWLSKRLPGDESRQADALTAFAASVGNERRQDAEDLVFAIVQVLGVDYRHKVIDALQAGSDPNRYIDSAMLAWADTNGSNTTGQFDASLQAAIHAHPDDPFVWEIAAVYCPVIGQDTHCLYPKAAETLVRIAPDNMYNWLLLVTSSSTDDARRREALHEAARRPLFNDYLGNGYLAFSRAIETGAVPVPSLIARPLLALAPKERPEASLASLEAQGSIPWPHLRPLLIYCGALPDSTKVLDPQTLDDCRTVGERLVHSHGAIYPQMIGVVLARHLAKGTPLAEEGQQARRLYSYLDAMDEKLGARQRMSYPSARFLRDISTQGELAALQRRVEYFGVPGQPPADWKPDDPIVLFTTSERMDAMIAIDDAGNQLVAQGRFAEAIQQLGSIEGQAHSYFTLRDAWRLPRLLMNLGKAHAALSHYAAAETHLLGAWGIVQGQGPTSKDARDCAQAIANLYAAWNRVEPDKGYDAKANEWRQTLKDLDAATLPHPGA